MKKKRKKKATLPYSQLTFQLRPFTRAAVSSLGKAGSAPDVPSGSQDEVAKKSGIEFAVKLFGKEGWHVDRPPNDICLRTFSRQLTDSTKVQWDTVHAEDCLYVHVPLTLSRDSFVALLDYAEEELEVARVIVCLDRDSQNFPALVKSFRFMGFEHATPSRVSASHGYSHLDQQATSSSRGFHFLVYDID